MRSDGRDFPGCNERSIGIEQLHVDAQVIESAGGAVVDNSDAATSQRCHRATEAEAGARSDRDWHTGTFALGVESLHVKLARTVEQHHRTIGSSSRRRIKAERVNIIADFGGRIDRSQNSKARLLGRTKITCSEN